MHSFRELEQEITGKYQGTRLPVEGLEQGIYVDLGRKQILRYPNRRYRSARLAIVKSQSGDHKPAGENRAASVAPPNRAVGGDE